MSDLSLTAQDSDRHIVERVLGGDVEVYRRLVTRHQDDLLVYAVAMLGDLDAAEEAVGQGLAHAFNGLARIPDRDAFLPFALRGVRYEVRERLSGGAGTDPVLTEKDREILTRAFRERRTSPAVGACLRSVLLEMPASIRESWVIFHLFTMKDEHASYVTGLDAPVTRRKAHEGRAFLAELFQEEDEPVGGRQEGSDTPEEERDNEDVAPPALLPADEDTDPAELP